MPKCYWADTKVCLSKGRVSRLLNQLYLLGPNVLNKHILKESMKIFLLFVKIKHVFIRKINFTIFYYIFCMYFICWSTGSKADFYKLIFLRNIFSYVFFSKHSSPFMNHVWFNWMENGRLQKNVKKYISCQDSSVCLSSWIFYCHNFITGEHLNGNTLLFESSSASMTNSLLFTASNVVLVKWL